MRCRLRGRLRHSWSALAVLVALLVSAACGGVDRTQVEPHDPAVLRRWLRSTGPAGRPLDLLLARDFAGFEDALGTLAERGYVIRAPGSSGPATPP
jgi:hypothetical protein